MNRKIEVDSEALGNALAMLDLAVWDMADCGAAMSGTHAGTTDSARKKMMAARGRVDHARAILNQELAPREWCDGCGDGKPGKMMHLDKGEMPCLVCASDEGFA